MKIKLNIIALLSIVVFTYQAESKQAMKIEPVVIAQKITLKSELLNQSRNIFISLPNDYYLESRDYPVLFVLDGDFFTQLANTVVKNSAISHQIENMIVVGISQKNRHQELKQPGAENFQRFIKSEVIQYVTSNYRTNGFSALYGHSLGGSFALFSMINEPNLFNAYLIISPVIDSQGTPQMDTLKTFFTDNKSLPGYLFLSKANESGNYADTIPVLADLIQNHADESFRWTYKAYPNKTHGTVPLIAMDDSLAHLYQGRIMPKIGELNDFNSMDDIQKIGGYQAVKNYYKQYSHRLRFTFPVPEIVYSRFAWIYFNDNQHELLAELVKTEGKDNEVVNYYLGSSYLSKKDYNRAIKLLKTDVSLNPMHARGWHTLGIAYRESGNNKAATEALNKSIKLAQTDSLKDDYKSTLNKLQKHHQTDSDQIDK